jgi:hypothetical protein
MDIKVIRRTTDLIEIESATRTTNVTTDELNALLKFRLHERLRNAIVYVIDHMIEDEDIDLDDYPYSKDELIDEIYVDFEDKLDADEIPFPADDEICDAVVDLIDFYVMNK